VNDQLMKKQTIMQGMGWGHMPEFMVANARDRRAAAANLCWKIGQCLSQFYPFSQNSPT
jgi:hypothetical protein